MNGQPQRDVRAIIVAVAWATALGGIGAWVTELGPWYYALRKPSWQPPDFLFGPAWTLIFTLAAIAGYRAWTAAAGQAGRGRIILVFALNAVLNVAWSWLFFRSYRPDWALLEVGLLWLSILAMILVALRFSRSAAGLLVPYLAWVSFAAYLNLTVAHLNQPFK